MVGYNDYNDELLKLFAITEQLKEQLVKLNNMQTPPDKVRKLIDGAADGYRFWRRTTLAELLEYMKNGT